MLAYVQFLLYLCSGFGTNSKKITRMKKLLTLFAAVVLAVGAYAQTTPSIQAIMAQESEKNPGVAAIMWQADSTISKVYLVYLYAVDTVAMKTTAPIGFLAGPASAYAIPNYPGYFGIGTATMLQYGQNYPKIKDNPDIPADTKTAFKTGWEENVNESDYTLKAGAYYAVVAGYNATGSTVTETQKGAIFTIAGEAQGVENVFESQKPVKFIAPDGQVRILRDGKMYNMSGALVK